MRATGETSVGVELPWPAWVDLAAPLALVAIVFARTVGFGFLDWDDYRYLVHNPLIAHPLAHGWRELLLTPRMGYPQPLTVLSQHLDLVIGHGAAWPFHLTNVVLHAVNVVLIAGIARSLGLSRRARLVALCLCACHPLVVEPVAWCTGRKDLLAGASVLGGFLLARRRDLGWAGAAGLVLAAAGGLLSKPTAAVLPMLIVADLVVLRRPAAWPLRAAVSVMAALSAAAVAVSYTTHASLGAVVTHAGLGSRLLLASQHLALQLQHYLVPTHLAVSYGERLPGPLASIAGAGGVAAVVALVTAGVVAARHGARVVTFTLAWAAVSFGPVSGLIPLNRGPADVYFYVPGVGLALCLGLGLARVRTPRLFPVTAGALVLACSLLASVQVDAWRSTTRLFAAAYEQHPDSQRVVVGYGRALAADGRIREAITVYEAGLRRFPPDGPDVLLQLGQGCVLLGDLPCAGRWYGEAARRFPEDTGAALRLVAVARVTTVPGDATAAADAVARRALAALAAVPAPARPARYAAFFARHLRADPLPARALRAYLAEPELAEVATALLQRYDAATDMPAGGGPESWDQRR
jgi:hypothetical protein